MTDNPDIDFGENDPIDLGRVNLTADGSVYADLYSIVEDPFIGTGRKIDLTALYERLGYSELDEIDEMIEKNLEDYDGQALSRKVDRVYYGRNQLKAKLEGMRVIWHYIEVIWLDASEGDILDKFIIHFDTNIRYASKG